MNVAGFSASGFGAGSIESLLADANNAGGARDAALAVFAPGNSHNTSNKTNHPCHEGYNPARAPEAPGASGRSYASQATTSRMGGGVQSHHHHHTHNPHHALFMSAIASSYPNNMGLLGGPSGMQHNNAPSPVQQTDALSAAGLCLDQLQHLVANTPSAQQQQRNAAVAAAIQQQQQQQQQQQHHRHSSWDEFLLLNPNLLEAAVANEAALQVATTANHHHHHQQHENGRKERATTSTSKPAASRLVSTDSDYGSYAGPPTGQTSSSSLGTSRQAMQQQREDGWLDELSLAVPSLAVEPLSGTAVLKRLRERMDDVLTRYIPCVDFLVQCQQELRKGLAVATQKHFSFNRRSFMTPKQFFQTYISRLPDNFYVKNRNTMENSALNTAMEGLQKLRGEAEKSQSQGCEAIKNTFLGGMKDGESWGLRKWLSRNGNALASCTDIECILNACQKLDKCAESTRKLAEILRPLAQQTLDRLKKDIPATYQERSTAHPYLPFFHRLEAALRGMTQFDPEDDDVICIDDDDEIEELKAQAKPAASKSRPISKHKTEPIVVGEGQGSNAHQSRNACRNQGTGAGPSNEDDASSSGESDNISIIEIVDVKPPGTKTTRAQIPAASSTSDGSTTETVDWTCGVCGQVNPQDATYCSLCGEPSPLKEFLESPVEKYLDRYDEPQAQPSSPRKTTGKKRKADDMMVAAQTVVTGRMPWPVQLDLKATLNVACTMAENLEHVAVMFESNQQDAVRPLSAPKSGFWNGCRYSEALRLFGSILRKPESPHFVERIDDDQLLQAGSPPFSHVIKNPLCFRDIVSALITKVDETHHGLVAGEDGKLSVSGLSGWNMWKGTDLLQAIDLVLLNSLAYGKAVEEGKSNHRAITNKLRRNLWAGIQDIVTEHAGDDVLKRKECTPTRRSETSGFVVYKIRER